MLDTSKAVRLYELIKELNEPREMHHWHASSIAQCPRAEYMARLGVPPMNTPTSALILRWAAGHKIEAAIRPYLESLYPGIQSNIRLTSDKLDLTGEYDNYNAPTKTIIEVKSVHDYAFKETEGKTGLKEHVGQWPNGNNMWGLKRTPYLAHEWQNHAYVMLLEAQGAKVENIDYIYVSLSGRLAVYSTEVQEDLLKSVTERLKTLDEAWETKTPPLCICSEGHELFDSLLQYCNYREEDRCCDINLIKEVKNDSTSL